MDKGCFLKYAGGDKRTGRPNKAFQAEAYTRRAVQGIRNLDGPGVLLVISGQVILVQKSDEYFYSAFNPGGIQANVPA